MSGVALFAVVLFGLLTMWVPSRWALSVFQLLILALAAFRIVVLARSSQRISLHPGVAVLAGVALWSGAQVLLGWTVDPFQTEEALLHWVVVTAAFAIALEVGDDRRVRERILTMVVAFATLLSIVAMVTVFASPPGLIAGVWDVGTGLPTLGPFVYRNQWAAFVEAVLPIALFRSFTDRDRRWVYAIAGGLLVASVIAAGSRMGTILCGAELLLIPAICAVRGLVPIRTLIAAGAGVLFSITGLTLAAGWQFLWSRFQEPNPFSLRWDLIQSSIEMFRERPWTGWGLGTWSGVYPGFARYDDGSFVNQAHCDWAQWAAEGGIFVLLALVWTLSKAVRAGLRSTWSLGLVAVFAHACVDYPFQQRPALAVFFFVMLGLALRDKGQG